MSLRARLSTASTRLRRHAPLLLRIAPAIAAAAYLGIYLTLGVLHLRYPFDLEWMEGGVVDHVRRILAGRKLYVRPTIDFVPFIYTPLYYYVSAAFAKVLGAGYLAPRLVSYLSSIGVLALIAAFVHRETRSRWAGLLAAGLFAATYPRAAGFFDLARVDSLFLLFVLGAFYLVRFRPSRAGRILAAALLALAFLTKQSALVLALPLMLHVALVDRRRSPWFIGATAGFIGLSALALELAHRGWFYYYAFWIPQRHPWVWRMIYDFWLEDLVPPLGLGLLAALFGVLAVPGERRRFYLLAGVGVVWISWSGRLHAGGWSNVNMPTYALLAILFGLGVHEAVRLAAPPPDAAEPAPPDGARRHAATIALLAALLQFANLAYDPRPLVPSARDEAAGHELLKKIAAADGEVLIPAHSYLPALVGKRTYAHEMAMNDLVGIDGGRPAAALRAELRSAFREKRFALIISDTEFLRKELSGHYVRHGEAFSENDVFWSVVGMRTRPKVVFAPSRGKP